MQNKISERILLIAFFLFFFITFFLITFFSKATFDAGDGIRHYMMARYSWQHPMLLLDLWAKPLFTFLLSPFAQFGMMGANVFQILCALFSSYFCFRIAKRLEIANGWLLPFFIFFAPIYFPVINSGLTEPFFGLTVVCAIFLLLEKKYIWSAIVISFLPFARNEGFLFLPAFALVLLFRKQYIPVFFVATGTILLTLIGFFVFHDIAWLFTHNPYKGHIDIYGQGELLHFIKQYNNILGIPLSILFLFGMLWMFLKLIQIKKTIKTDSFFTEELFLIFGCLLIYFVGHSIFWWQGLFSSFGLTRMMAAIIPLAALICLRGFNHIFFICKKILPSNFFPYVFGLASLICIGWVSSIPFRQWYFPFQLGVEEKVVQTAAEWHSKSETQKSKIYFLHPFLPLALDMDPFDNNVMQELWGFDTIHPENSVEENNLLFWDAHYSPNEGKIKLNTLLENPHFELLQTIKPGKEYITLGGNNFEVYIFQKNNKEKRNTVAIIEPTVIGIDKLDSANISLIINQYTLTNEKSKANNFIFYLKEDVEYGPGFNRKISDVKNYASINSLNVRMEILPKDILRDIFLIFEINDSQGKQLLWDKEEIKIKDKDSAQWKKVDLSFPVSPALTNDENFFKIYIWNFGKKNFSLRDIEIQYKTRMDGKTIIVW